MTTYHAEWPILDPSLTYEALKHEARRELRAMLSAERLTPAEWGSWKRDNDTLTWTGEVRPSRRRGPGNVGGGAQMGMLDSEPLLAACEARGITRTDKRLARAVAAGRITRAAADQLCCITLRVHPFEVWGDAWFGELEEAS